MRKCMEDKMFYENIFFGFAKVDGIEMMID